MMYREDGFVGCWNPAIEMMPKAELKSLQYKLLKNLVNKLYDQSRFYRGRMESQGVTPDDIRSLDDVSQAAVHVQEGLP